MNVSWFKNIRRNALNESCLEEIKTQLCSPLGIIPFVGAGLSIPLGFPGWTEYLYGLCDLREGVSLRKVITELIANGQYEEAAEHLYNELGERRFNDDLKLTFSKEIKTKNIGAIQYLPLIAKGPVVTTNFDCALETIFERAGKRFEKIYCGKNVPLQLALEALVQSKRVLFKLHGDSRDPESRILTLTEYEDSYGKNIDTTKPLPQIMDRMASMPLLFIGCSLNKDRTIQCLKNNIHYAMVEKPEIPEKYNVKDRDLSKAGIGTIWYPSNEHVKIEEILKYLYVSCIKKKHIVFPGYTVFKEINTDSNTFQICYEARSEQENESSVFLASLVNPPKNFEPLKNAFLELKTKLSDERFASIIDIDANSDHFHIIYEFVVGEYLEDNLSKSDQPYSFETCIELIEQIGGALDWAHVNGIVHGEFSPNDIVLLSTNYIDNDQNSGNSTISENKRCNENGNVLGHKKIKILNTGVIDALRKANMRFTLKSENLPYRAPEQLDEYGEMLSPSADIWVLAVICYEILTGHKPFNLPEDGNNESWKTIIKSKNPEEPTFYNPNIKPQVSQVLLKALEKNIESRFKTAKEFISALKKANNEETCSQLFDTDLEDEIEAGKSLFIAESDDEKDIVDRLTKIAKNMKLDFFTWSATSGLTDGSSNSENNVESRNPIIALDRFMAFNSDAMLVFKDLDVVLGSENSIEDPDMFGAFVQVPSAHSRNPMTGQTESSMPEKPDGNSYGTLHKDNTVTSGCTFAKNRFWKELVESKLTSLKFKKVVVCLLAEIAIPNELQRVITVIKPSPVDIPLLREILRTVDPVETKAWQSSSFEAIARHSTGLAPFEIINCARLAYEVQGCLKEFECLLEIRKYKANLLSKQGILEYSVPNVTLDDIVGLDNFKEWFMTRLEAMIDPLSSSILPQIKGVLFGGMPGCGKSLCAKAIAGTLKWPLLRFDMGKVFSGRLGQSEHNIRQALHWAEDISPAVLWIDEIEKSVSFEGSGTSSRVLQTFLVWLNERNAPVFIVGTANQGNGIPEELIRSGRFDECFFVDLPSPEERKEIFGVFIKKYFGLDHAIDRNLLSDRTFGYSNAEIETIVLGTLYATASVNKSKLETEDFLQVLSSGSLPLALRPNLLIDFMLLRMNWSNFARLASIQTK